MKRAFRLLLLWSLGALVPASGCTGFPLNPPSSPGMKAAAQSTQGLLRVRIKWPTRDLPDFQAQTIPLRTRSIRLEARNAQDIKVGEMLIPRPEEAAAESVGSLDLPAGLDYRILAGAFTEANPGGESTAIASGNATNVPIVRSRTTVVTITLTATYAPAITALEPTYGLPGTLVTIRGTTFGGSQGFAYGVDFGGVSAEATRSSDTEVVAKVPLGVSDMRKANVRVTVDGVPSTSTALFIVGSAGFEASLMPIEETWGNNGVSVGLNSGSSNQGLSSSIEAASAPAPEGLSPVIEAATASLSEGLDVTIE